MGRKWLNDVTPAIRVLRTAIQAILAGLAAVPVALGMLNLSAETTAKVSAITAALVVIVSAIQNGIEARTGKTALAKREPYPEQP